jgi:hypothetical protein
MAEASRTAYEELVKRRSDDPLPTKRVSIQKRIVRDSETKDPDRIGYYEILKKVQRSKDSTSLKSRKA